MAENRGATVAEHDTREGMTVLLTDSARATPGLWASLDQRERTLNDVAHISFLFPEKAASPSSKVHANDSLCGSIFRKFKVPLANTIFQSGHVSTLFAQRMKCSLSPDGPTLVAPEEHHPLTKQTIQLVDLLEPPISRELYTSLKPITEPRIVDHAVGNILRTLHKGSRDHQSFPASQELEAAVSRWRTVNPVNGHRVGVWALVTPRELLQGSQVPSHLGNIMNCLEAGSRLHHVLSGGGGWGNKQGLLSLDPILQPDIVESDASVPPWLRETEDGFGFETFEQTVKPGDMVTFCATQEQSATFSSSRAEHRKASFAVGTCPLREEMPLTDGENDLDASIAVATNHFGVLSSRGLEYSRSVMKAEKEPTDASKTPTISTRTRLDAPHTVYHEWSEAVG